MKARTRDGVEWTLRTARARREDRAASVADSAPSIAFVLLIALVAVLVILAPVLVPAGLGWLVPLAAPLAAIAAVGYRMRCAVVVARRGETVSRYVTRGLAGAWRLSREMRREIRRSPDAELR